MPKIMASSRPKLNKDHLCKSVRYDGYYYATLDFAEPDGIDGSGVAYQADFIELPCGWEIAPNEPEIAREVIGKHTWQACVIILADDTGYCVKGNGDGCRWAGRGMLVNKGNSYRFGSFGGLRVLIRAKDPNVIAAHDYRSQLTFELWKKKCFTDCVIVWADAEEPCHRAVLAAASPVFERMLSSRMEEAVQQRIVIKDVQSEIGQALLRFMYLGELDRDFQKPIDLLRAAHMYQVEALIVPSVELVLDKLDANSATDAIRMVKHLREDPKMEELWSSLIKTLSKDPSLLSAVMMNM